MNFREMVRTTEINEEAYNKTLAFLYMMDEDVNFDMINESNLNESIDTWLNKVGISVKRGKGLISYIKDFTKGVGLLFLALIKGDTKKAKDLLTSITKEEILDFVLKLDLVTLHIITGPIHVIDAITGWDIMANVESLAKNSERYLEQFYDAMDSVRQSIVKLMTGPKRVGMIKNLDKITNDMPAAAVV